MTEQSSGESVDLLEERADVIDLPDFVEAMRECLSGVATVGTEPVDGLTEAQGIRVIAAAEAIKAAAAALQVSVTSRFVDQRDDDATQAAARGERSAREVSRSRSATRAEVALARRCSPSQADRHVGLARALVHEMPCTMTALTRGEISEWRATIIVRETACLSSADRAEADRRLAGCLTTLGDRELAAAARRACIDIDQESVVERRKRAVASRSVSVRPAPDGMAWLSVLGPIVDVVGALASLRKGEQQRHVATGDAELDATRAADQRGKGAWMADTALERLSGRAEGQAQPVEVALVMSESAIVPESEESSASTSDAPVGSAGPGTSQPVAGEAPARPIADPLPSDAGDAPGRRVPDPAPSESDEPEGRTQDRQSRRGQLKARPWSRHQPIAEGQAEVPGWGPVPAEAAREHLLRLLDEGTGVWLRRLWTTPDGRDLVAMDSKRRLFDGGLRRLIELRDAICRVPWCDAPISQIDHVLPFARGGATSADNGMGACQRHNLVKEEFGWVARVVSTGLVPEEGPHEVELTTPTGDGYSSLAPPVLGHGRHRGPVPDSSLERHLEQLLLAA